MTKTTLIVAAFIGAWLLAAAPASAQQILQNGTGVCKSALPVFDGNIRNRPTAISNEGSAPAFVSCSMEDAAGSNNQVAGLFIHNNGPSVSNVSCTFVNGSPFLGVTYYTKSGVLAAGVTAIFSWNAEDDNQGVAFDALVNFSCKLLPGVELRMVTRIPT